MRWTAVWVLGLTGCGQTMAMAPVETMPVPPPVLVAPEEPPPPTLDAVPSDQIDVVSTGGAPTAAAAIEITFQHPDVCPYGQCQMRIWKDGLVSFSSAPGRRNQTEVGWSRVRSSDVARWLSQADALTPPPPPTGRARRSCRNYYFTTYADITFHTGERKVSLRANDPCNSQETQAMVSQLVAAAPLPKPH